MFQAFSGRATLQLSRVSLLLVQASGKQQSGLQMLPMRLRKVHLLQQRLEK